MFFLLFVCVFNNTKKYKVSVLLKNGFLFIKKQVHLVKKLGKNNKNMCPKDVPKTAFSTRVGTFAYLRMPMGLKNAPIAFQRFMTEVFSDLLYRGARVYR